MNATRAYAMGLRAASVETTRARIVSAAQDLFLSRWYDDVTLADVATAAEVSAQTVINHFGGKEGVFRAALERASNDIQARRDVAHPGDVGGAVEILVDDYE